MNNHSWLWPIVASGNRRRRKTILSFFLFSLCFFSLCPLCLCGSFSPGAFLQVFPPDVHLSTARARQTLVVQATFPDGITRDVTSQAAMKLVNPDLCKLEKNQLVPLADGATELIVAYAEHSVKVPITIKDVKIDLPVSFKLDVMPVFMAPAATSAAVMVPRVARTVFACRSSASIPTGTITV